MLARQGDLCRPRDPEAKGLVERANEYLETSFLPGRQFASPADFNAQLAGWVATVNARFRRHLECAPADRIAADRAAMTAPAAGGPGHRVAAGRRGCPATTTSAWTPMTTPWTRR